MRSRDPRQDSGRCRFAETFQYHSGRLGGRTQHVRGDVRALRATVRQEARRQHVGRDGVDAPAAATSAPDPSGSLDRALGTREGVQLTIDMQTDTYEHAIAAVQAAHGLNPGAVTSSWPDAPAAVPRPGPESLSGEDLGQGWTERMLFDTIATVVPLGDLADRAAVGQPGRSRRGIGLRILGVSAEPGTDAAEDLQGVSAARAGPWSRPGPGRRRAAGIGQARVHCW
ncbi:MULTISPECIES: hypothetical protein [unclassified Streptomyces]|uniref:hypothetical protein n=1 Tax=unclassified Streptomyces TaxID=2593676 RepID=UPI0036EBF47E